MSVVEELSGDGSRIVTSWKRTTVADGDWLQHNTISPLNERDVFLAEKIDELSGNADDRLDEEIAARIAGDEQLYDELSTVSSDFYSFSADVETSAYTLSAAITAEADLRERVDESLLGKIEQLQNATDVVDVVGTHAALVAYDEPLTKNDVVKVLVDETKNNLEYYWRVVGDEPTKPYQWTEVGTITPYYSKAEIDNLEEQLSATISNTYLSANGTDISAGKNLDVVIQSNNPRVAFKTKDDVSFDGVSSTTLSATTAYGSSAKFTNISANKISADLFKSDLGTVDTFNLKFISAGGDKLTVNESKAIQLTASTLYGQSKNSNVDSLISSAQNGQDAYDKVSTAYWSAYKDSTHSGSGKLSANFSISAGENLDMEISDNIIKLNGKPAGVIHDDNLSGLGVQGDLLGLNSAVNIYVPFIANQNRNSAIVEIGNTPVPRNMGDYNEGFAVYRNHTYEVHEGTKTADLGTTINFTGMVVTHSADAIGGFSHYSKYGDVFDLNYNGGDYWLKHLWLDKNGLNFTDNGNTNYSANLNYINLKFYDNQNNIPGTNTKYESQNVNASSIYKWNNTSDIVTQSATLSAGFGIQFTSAATTAMGIKLDATINADNKIAAIGGIELAGGGISSISVPGSVFTGRNVNFYAGDNIDFTTANNSLTINLHDNITLGETESKQVLILTEDEGDIEIDSDGPEIVINNTYQSQLQLYNNKIVRNGQYTTWDKVINASNQIPIVVGSTGTDLNTLYIY